MPLDQSDYYQRDRPYAGSWLDADARPARPLAFDRRELSRRRLRSPVTYLLVGALSFIMMLGAAALWRATASDTAKASECEIIKDMILSEADEAVLHGLFPTRDQQDRWAQLMQACSS